MPNETAIEERRKRRAQVQRTWRQKKAERAWGIKHETDLLPIDTAKNLILEARANGATYPEIQVLTGVHKHELQRIATIRKYITRKNERKILTGLDEADVRAYLPSTIVSVKKSAQICRSLEAQGFTMKHQEEIIENNLHMSGQFLKHLTRAHRVGVTKKNEDIMLWLERNIGGARGPGVKCQTWARNRGYFPLRNYDALGDLVYRTLNGEQRAILEQLQS